MDRRHLVGVAIEPHAGKAVLHLLERRQLHALRARRLAADHRPEVLLHPRRGPDDEDLGNFGDVAVPVAEVFQRVPRRIDVAHVLGAARLLRTSRALGRMLHHVIHQRRDQRDVEVRRRELVGTEVAQALRRGLLERVRDRSLRLDRQRRRRRRRGAGHLLLRRGNHRPGFVDLHGFPPAATVHRRDGDDVAVRRQDRNAGRRGVEANVGGNHPRVRARQPAGQQRLLIQDRRIDGEDVLPFLELRLAVLGVPELRRRDRRHERRVDPDHRHVLLAVPHQDVSLDLRRGGELHLDRRRRTDDALVGEDEAAPIEHEPGAARRRAPEVDDVSLPLHQQLGRRRLPGAPVSPTATSPR